jgi:hypothetical protein
MSKKKSATVPTPTPRSRRAAQPVAVQPVEPVPALPENILRGLFKPSKIRLAAVLFDMLDAKQQDLMISMMQLLPCLPLSEQRLPLMLMEAFVDRSMESYRANR